MTELRCTRPCRLCREAPACSLVRALQSAVVQHDFDHPRAPDLEVVIDCRFYVRGDGGSGEQPQGAL
jgi:hypothetical protein